MADVETTREQVKAEREAKKLAKQAGKKKTDVVVTAVEKSEKSKEEIMAEREAKKLAKQAGKVKVSVENNTAPVQEGMKKSNTDTDLAQKLEKLHISEEKVATKPVPVQEKVVNKPIVVKEKVVLSKAERRAIQEAQRAAKAAPKTTEEVKEKKPEIVKSVKVNVTIKPIQKPLHRVKLFNHLYTDKETPEFLINSNKIHPAITKLGLQYSKGTIIGSNSRCIAFLNAMKFVISDYETPPQKEFSRGLESCLQPCMTFLQQCRPISVSMTNALRFIKWQITQLPSDENDADLKARLLESIDGYIRDHIEKAAQAISISVQEKISNEDVILTFGCSSLIKHILEEAHRRKVDFRVIVVDARPLNEGQEMLRRLVSQGIKCTCVLVNAVAFIMPEVTKVLLGAHALLANGYVMSRCGTAQVAMVARSFNVPVLVCCETHKFSERVQTDAFVYNEIGNPDDLILKSGTLENKTFNPLANWSTLTHLTPLNLCYDITPPELVTAVVTEVAILPCTSVPVILRIKPSEIGY